jgi:hypothetical protein
VENFVGNKADPPRNADPVSLPARLHAFAASLHFQQNQQLTRVGGFLNDAAQQMREPS